MLIFFKFKTNGISTYQLFLLDCGTQKPAFEKLSNNGASSLKYESLFSVSSSDRIIDSDGKLLVLTVNFWEFSSYIYKSLNCGFLYFSKVCS